MIKCILLNLYRVQHILNLLSCVVFLFFAVQKDKTTVHGLKRTLSDGNGNDEKDDPNTKRELKRTKMQNNELEAKLELKITAKAGAHPKLEKVCMLWNMLNFLNDKKQ